MSRYVGKFEITEREREILEALISYGNLDEAVKRIGVRKGTANQRLHRLRERYRKAKKLVQEYETYRMRLIGRIGVKYLDIT